jgi:FAD/FMN-containing dehydrogenase
LVSARVVLANGTAVTASKDENADLFWALQGAGHNFGIVTEFTYKIYDARVNDTWVLEELVFTGDMLEELFSVHNQLMKSQPPELVLWSFLVLMPEIDPLKVCR